MYLGFPAEIVGRWRVNIPSKESYTFEISDTGAFSIHDKAIHTRITRNTDGELSENENW